MASVAAALLAVLGAGAALVKRESTGYGQHVETSLLDGLLFLNAAPSSTARDTALASCGRPNRRSCASSTPPTAAPSWSTSAAPNAGASCAGCSSIDDGGLDYSTPEGLSRLSDREWNRAKLAEIIDALRGKSADQWEAALLAQPAAVAKCNTLAEWIGHEQAQADELVVETDDPALGRVPLVGPPVRIGVGRGPAMRRPGRRHGGGAGALAGHRIVDLSSFWAGPLAARLLAELGADVVKVEPPGGEGGFQVMPVLPNIYVDGNRSKRGLVLDLKTPRTGRGCSTSSPPPTSSSRTPWPARGSGSGSTRRRCGRSTRRSSTPGRRASASTGPLATRPSLRLRGAGGDGDGDDPGRRAAAGAGQLHGQRLRHRAAAGGRDRAARCWAGPVALAVHTVDASLALTSTLFQSEDVASLACDGAVARPGGRGPRGTVGGPAPLPGRGRVGHGVLRDGVRTMGGSRQGVRARAMECRDRDGRGGRRRR